MLLYGDLDGLRTGNRPLRRDIPFVLSRGRMRITSRRCNEIIDTIRYSGSPLCFPSLEMRAPPLQCIPIAVFSVYAQLARRSCLLILVSQVVGYRIAMDASRRMNPSELHRDVQYLCRHYYSSHLEGAGRPRNSTLS